MQTFGRILIAISIVLIVFTLAIVVLVTQSRLNNYGFDPVQSVILGFAGLISGSIIFGLGSVQYELQRLNDAMRGYSTKPHR